MPALRPRLLVALAILLACATSTGLLLRRELGAPRLGASAAATPGPARLAYALLDADGRQLGVVRFERSDEAAIGTLSRFGVEATLPVLGQLADLQLAAEIFRPAGAERLEVEATLLSAGQRLELSAEIIAGELRGTLETGGESIPLRLPVSPAILEAGRGALAVELPWLAIGETAMISGFDPLTLDHGRLRLRCLRHERLDLAEGGVETQLLSIEAGGVTSRAWVDRDGMVVRAETPLGLTLERLPFDQARVVAAEPRTEHRSEIGDGLGDDPAGREILSELAVRPTGVRPFRGAREMTVRLSGIEGLTVPVDPSQRSLGDGRYRLAVVDRESAFPVSPEAELATAGGGSDPHLAADAFVQSDHPTIRNQATHILRGEVDPWPRALRLHDWVYERIDKEAVMSIPSALEVLATRRGDCNEHAVLYAALARSAGIPTRLAVGLVWSDELAGFYYHAWPEVHIDGWLRVDPTLGQPVADATHLKLLEGGVETWPRLLPWLGRLEIEVEEVR